MPLATTRTSTSSASGTARSSVSISNGADRTGTTAGVIFIWGAPQPLEDRSVLLAPLWAERLQLCRFSDGGNLTAPAELVLFPLGLSAAAEGIVNGEHYEFGERDTLDQQERPVRSENAERAFGLARPVRRQQMRD